MKIIERLNPTNSVSFNRAVAHALGLGAAVVYSALISKQVYYEQRGMLDEKGFFFSSIADLQESTSMGKYQQSNAIRTLTDAGLVECKKRGMPARRCFRVRDDLELLDKLLKQGEEAMTELNPIAQKPNKNAPSSCTETAQHVGGFSDNKSAQNEPYTLNPNIIKSKGNNPNQSIQSGGDGIDMIDNPAEIVSVDERSDYSELIRGNIEYDGFSEEEQEKVDELVEIMLDVICSTKQTIRVNKEEVPNAAVKSRFLKLTHGHIEYVLLAMKRNTSAVGNIRSYLITTLYNAPTTMDSFFTALVNHDMYGSA